MLPQLYAITDNQLMSGDQLLKNVSAAINGGCKIIQYRDKSANRQQRFRNGQRLADLCRDRDCKLLINDDIDLAKTIVADGVHLGQDDEPISRAKDILGDQAIIGITCHASLFLAQEAQQQGASYVAFGRFFESKTKPQASVAPLDLLSAAKRILSIPIVAIGGITLENSPQLILAGADILAVCHGLFSANHVQFQAESFCQLFNRYKPVDVKP